MAQTSLKPTANVILPPTTPLASASFLFRADGSASWQVGNAHLIASVSGPMEVSKRDEQPTVATLEVTVRPDIGVSCMFFLNDPQNLET